jgi:hypothetical protein
MTQTNNIAWEAVLSTGNFGTHDAILNSILRAAGRNDTHPQTIDRSQTPTQRDLMRLRGCF